MMRKYRQIKRSKCNAACHRAERGRSRRESVNQCCFRSYIAGKVLVIWTRWEGIGDVEVEISDAGTGREKDGDRGLGKSVSICTFDERFLALGAG
jgi:hypothetical protein